MCFTNMYHIILTWGSLCDGNKVYIAGHHQLQGVSSIAICTKMQNTYTRHAMMNSSKICLFLAGHHDVSSTSRMVDMHQCC